MTDYFARHQVQPNIGIPLSDLAKNAVIDAIDAIMPPNRLMTPREGHYDDFAAAAAHNDREARLSSADIIARLDDHLERLGFAYFDECFLANPHNAAMHAAYRTARSLHSADLNAALQRAWTMRRRDWEVRAAIPGHQVRPDDGEVVIDGNDDPSRRFAGLKAKIRSFVTRVKNAR